MRRDYVTLELRHVDRDGDRLPTAVLRYDGPSTLLEERLTDAGGEPLGRERVDIAFRLRTADGDATGVFSLTNRLTGEFVVEVNADAESVRELVDAARRDDDPDDADGCYRVVVERDGEAVASYEKRTLLVYDDEGGLLRQHSLIPSGVEL
ncbi:hypothetical protein C475_18158 [Halosimplex carlsbadense 2-9-1]|uniref:Uncharacterized protein n=1 Tax=Halosimplex carlsbadense 2-9-1 TaxID=797114 RepID=M0CJC7_9EURY|nr:DUF5793 family protein [Halosimplex carlsbadense]ELZ22462.1 hypothetical protein C475_18158 [Halosimplex carlsbadense 2-9-1]